MQSWSLGRRGGSHAKLSSKKESPLSDAGASAPSTLSDEDQYREMVEKNLLRNYLANLVHGLLGQTGFRLVQAPTFLPAYVFTLSGSELLVGLALAAQPVGAALSSLVGASLIEHRKRVLPVGFAVGMMMRVQVLGLALSGLFLPPQQAFWAVCVILLLFGLFQGMQGVMFNFLMSKVIPVDRRGRLTGLRNFLAGITASFVAYVGGRHFIEANTLGNGYSATFLTAFIMTSLGLLALLAVREPEPPTVRPKTRLRHRFAELPELLRGDPDFTNFFLARALTALGMIAVPFYILYAGQVVGLSGTNIGLLTIAFMLAQTTTNLAWGTIADRKGNRFVFILSVALWMLATATLMMTHSIMVFLAVFACLGAGLGGYQIASQNLVLEFGSRDDLPMRIAISNSATSVMMAVSPILGGLLSEQFSFITVFMVTLVFQAGSLVMIVLRVREPRFRRGKIH
ncbi:MAG: MFS transporter [Alphaproteobacteria bacterium]|nr:MAG: MFS transporter [Alphaproteobacteria bacterium]